MAEEEKRIIDQITDSELSSGDFVMVDSSSEGTRKFDLGAGLTAINASIAAEATARSSADATINEAIAGLTSDLTEEALARESAELELQTSISAETAAREAAINTEATARTNADTTLQGNITAEATARANAVTAEATARTNAINAEATARAAADTAINGEITQLKEDLAYLYDGYEIISFDIIENSYPAADGTFPAFNNWNRSDYIPVTSSNAIHVKNTGRSTGDNAWYDSGKNIIGRFNITLGDDVILTPPINAAYMVISNQASSFFDAVYKVVTGLATKDDVAVIKEDFNQVIVKSENLLDVSRNVPNTYIDQNTGIEITYANWQSSEYIPIEAGTGYYHAVWNNAYWDTPSSVYYAFYNNTKTFTHGSYTDNVKGYVMQAASGDAYLRVSAQNANMTTSLPMVGKVSDLGDIIQSTDINNYIPYGNSLYKDTVKTTLDDYIASNSAVILLPSTVYIAVGRQITFYKPNYLRCKNPDDYVCYWSSTLTSAGFDEHIRFEPTTTGTYSATLYVMNRYTGETVTQKTISIVVVADTTRSGKKVLFIGDSLTNAGFYPYEIQKHLSGEGVESIGTITTTAYLDSDPSVTTRVSVNHEGRGGWSAQDYITKSSKSGVSNAFWNPNTSAFDFMYYLANNNYSLPDIVFVNLGTNGTVNPTAEINAIKTIITSIRAYSATVPIVVSAIANGNATQDRYIDIYLTKIRESQLAEFDGTMNYVYIAPIYLNINRQTDFKTETVAESARNPLEVTRQIDSVHPSRYGYFKFADVYWSVIQHILG